MGPVTQSDGHDTPRLIDESVPSVAAVIEERHEAQRVDDQQILVRHLDDAEYLHSLFES